MFLWKLFLNGEANNDLYITKEDALKTVEKLFARRMNRDGYEAMQDRESFRLLASCCDPDSPEYHNETTVVIDRCFVTLSPV